MMKAITLWQPYASLIAMGQKKFETRSWQTTHRGLLAIHAAKTTRGLDVVKEWMKAYTIREIFGGDELYDSIDDLPLGKIVCIVNLVETYPVEKLMGRHKARVKMGPQETIFGDYSLGRFAWRLDLVKRLEDPIPVRGRQGLWNWEPPSDFDMSGFGKLVSGSGTVKFAGLLQGEGKIQS